VVDPAWSATLEETRMLVDPLVEADTSAVGEAA
jgi:hypothetical protein